MKRKSPDLFTGTEVKLHSDKAYQGIREKSNLPMIVYKRANLQNSFVFNDRHKPFGKEQLDNGKPDEEHPKQDNHCPKHFLIHILPLSCLLIKDRKVL